MKPTKYDGRLPQLRVSEKLHQQLLKICQEQEMSLPDVRRAALFEYVQPPTNAQKLIPLIRQVLAEEDETDVDLPVKGRIVADEQMGNKVEWLGEVG